MLVKTAAPKGTSALSEVKVLAINRPELSLVAFNDFLFSFL
jgi:hypothetical protein